MASASISARTARARAPAAHTRPPAARVRPSAARVRWDRLGRVAMLCVLVVLAYLYLSAGIHLVSTYHQAHGARAKVAAMEQEHAALRRQHEALGRPGAVEAQARKLGMMKHDELPYIVGDLPNN
jgi:cell division protein FtsB